MIDRLTRNMRGAVRSQDRGDTRYYSSVQRQPLLTREEEVSLAARVQAGDKAAAEILVRSHLRLVIKVASRYRNYGLPMNELVQEGSLGLMQAVERFDPDRGVRLATYAMWWIKAAIQDYILRSWSMVRIGTTAAQKALFFNLRKLKAKLRRSDETRMGETLDPADVGQIATTLGVRDRDVRLMEMRMSGGDQSLNAPMSADSGDEWLDQLADDKPDQEELLVEKDLASFRTRMIRGALDALNARERLIITRRHLAEASATLEALGSELGISKERVRQIESRAMRKLADLVEPQLRKALGSRANGPATPSLT
ncbi:RNA polymerase sigma factor RpoH [Tistrella bauzanensis]|uniref:RNA polymerase sigma factor RpoH n=1 Tax=Tistrella bauzanensis TaxID=657419 RepID=A0ABQ1I7C5_9PROT|nr:RNA polymerase factor sigma-32 [Tistrella bauzanensis]GGB24056.1 RNA polymerase sigma factor RpoH [Tistrella bauzanensis]